jgi:hypothetical protein
MNVIVVRGATGVVTWIRVGTGLRTFAWRCSRDGFQINAPTDAATTEAFLVSIAQHSQALIGTIAQVVQLVV